MEDPLGDFYSDYKFSRSNRNYGNVPNSLMGLRIDFLRNVIFKKSADIAVVLLYMLLIEI